MNHYLSLKPSIPKGPSFGLHTIKDDGVISILKFFRIGKEFQEYGQSIPDTMLAKEIKQKEAYQTFIKYFTGLIPPKKSRDVALELGNYMFLIEAEEEEAARRVHATHERLVTKSNEPSSEPANRPTGRRRTYGISFRDTPRVSKKKSLDRVTCGYPWPELEGNHRDFGIQQDGVKVRNVARWTVVSQYRRQCVVMIPFSSRLAFSPWRVVTDCPWSSLILLSRRSFDVIVGMDWLSKRKFVIACHEKVVRIPLEGNEILHVHGERTQGVVKTLMNTKTKEEHEVHLKLVLESLRKEKMYAMFSKCEFWLEEVHLLGHVVNHNVFTWTKERPKTARDHQKCYVDYGRKPLEFEVGDHLLLKVTPWKSVVRFGKKGKLAPRYVASFEILERIGLVAFRLRLPEELNSVHDTFHVSNLKKCLADTNLHVPLEEIKIEKKPLFC
nr:putative reverse transcriptase domain-containing protein [Tanacetum cinerariifolium]